MTISTVNTIEAKEEFSELLSRVAHQKERIILTRRGKEIAVLIPMEDWHKLKTWQEKQELEEALASLKEAREQGVISFQELKNLLHDENSEPFV